MNKIELKIKEIESVFYLVFTDIASISEDNFDRILAELDDKISQILTLKEELKNNYSKQILMQYEEKLSHLAKQLKERFDNIIREKKTEQAKIGLELSNIQNKKKLAIYSR